MSNKKDALQGKAYAQIIGHGFVKGTQIEVLSEAPLYGLMELIL